MGNITSIYRTLIQPAFQQPYTEGSSFEEEIFCEYINSKGLPIEREVSLTTIGIKPQDITVKNLKCQWTTLVRFIKNRTQLPKNEIIRLLDLIEDYSFNTSSQSFDFVLWDSWNKNMPISIVECNGLFHYQAISNREKDEVEFAQQLVRDYIKYRETKKLGIDFYEYNAARYHSNYTPAWERDRIHQELDQAFRCA